ncbi:MAG TPA: ribosome biogenesis GTPase Der, partial [Gemmataceae bacterium]|nr:ribosome biogenesis GTPase Der [Gemmataceae bacterium]
GVTRDRLSSLVRADGRAFELTDTGGMGIRDVDNLTDDVERQIRLAIDRAAVVLFLVDVRTGPVPLDDLVAERLRQAGKPVVLVVNKCDTPQLEAQVGEFHKLGHGEPISVSAQQDRGRARLFARLLPLLPPGDAPPDEEPLKLAIVGRRNTGKSTFINCLAREERVIVSEVPGTTRDSVDVRFERDGKAFVAIDTAGVRKKRSLANDVEFYSLARAERSIRRADVVLLFLDARSTVSRVDKQLAEYILDAHKPAIFVVNKWDLALAQGVRTGEWADYLHKHFPSLDFVPMAFITAKAGKNVQQVLNLAQSLHEQAGARVGTGDLNRVLRAALEETPPPMRQNRRPKVYFATQAGTNPPTVVLMTNGPELFDNTYLRYLEKTFRDRLPFSEVPIKLTLRLRHGAGGPAAEEAPAEAEAPPPEPKKRRKRRERNLDEQASPESGLWTDV